VRRNGLPARWTTALRVLCGLNRCWFTRLQHKRMHKLAAGRPLAPAQLVERIEALLAAPPREGFDALHALEAEVLAPVSRHMPEVDLDAVQRRHRSYLGA
jgi:hypothetical protein